MKSVDSEEGNQTKLDDNFIKSMHPADSEENNQTSMVENFMTRMDTAYDYGTAAIIVVGSAVDYSLYWILTDNNETNVSEKAEIENAEENLPNSEKEPEEKTVYSALKSYVEEKQGAVELPKQIGQYDWRKGERTYLMSKWFDAKTISDGFLDMNNSSYLRLRGGYQYDYRGKNEWIYSVAARIKIPKTKKRLDLIIGDETKNSADKSLEGTADERQNSIALGFRLLRQYFDFIDAKASVGIAGIDNPYAKVTFFSEVLLQKWLLQPSQNFKYGARTEFEEWTNLEFKRRIAGNQLASVLLQRSTISHIEGMSYFFQPSISYELGSYGVWTPFLGVYGRTAEQPADEDGYIPKRGVYRYAAGLNWSKQAKRKYIVYRLQPILAYDDKYDFIANYEVKALLEIYFGLRE